MYWLIAAMIVLILALMLFLLWVLASMMHERDSLHSQVSVLQSSHESMKREIERRLTLTEAYEKIDRAIGEHCCECPARKPIADLLDGKTH